MKVRKSMALNLRDRLLAQAKQKAAESNQTFRKKPIWSFKPQNGETWLVRALTDGNHMMSIRAHGFKKILPSGKERHLEILCLTQFGMDCPHCAVEKPVFRDFLCMIMLCKEYKDASGKVFPICTDKGETGTITLDDGKKIPANPIRVFLRSPGKGYANHFQLLEMDSEYEDNGGLAGRDMKITRNGSGLDTNYVFIPKDAKPLVKPTGLDEKYAALLETVMTAIAENDMPALIDLILPVFELPDGTNEYPSGSDYTFPEADDLTEDGNGGGSAEPPFTPDTKVAPKTSEKADPPATSASRQRRRVGAAGAASKQSDAADDGDGDDD